jgi:hypothetical protein
MSAIVARARRPSTWIALAAACGAVGALLDNPADPASWGRLVSSLIEVAGVSP